LLAVFYYCTTRACAKARAIPDFFVFFHVFAQFSQNMGFGCAPGPRGSARKKAMLVSRAPGSMAFCLIFYKNFLFWAAPHHSACRSVGPRASLKT
jgi:hypothetical protein